MTDILLRKAQAVRAGAQGDEDYDVIGPAAGACAKAANAKVVDKIFVARKRNGRMRNSKA